MTKPNNTHVYSDHIKSFFFFFELAKQVCLSVKIYHFYFLSCLCIQLIFYLFVNLIWHIGKMSINL